MPWSRAAGQADGGVRAGAAVIPRGFAPALRGPRIVQSMRWPRDPIGLRWRQRGELGPVVALRILPNRGEVICAMAYPEFVPR
jgi:hypothetical protein